ncbi:hypothetical protein PLEOSDRAFT_1032088 [Pleurotus ostreatus PC15]|uniref:Zn(2)-C6 fungal-type domain-containing protein n=1 Tax=Pleurotus ostreatus (strain PC15) TaxID=1137138 RepID=A0A067NZS1_PLEO1|nr:hypothetical protein PLEOSDRAFT_1032088 [Pleurotus ostreatus PC15]
MATFTTYAEAAQQSSQSQAAVIGNNTIASTSAYTNGPEPPVASSQSKDGDEDGGKKKKARRRKVNHACLYCRRSHMTCDEGRPCQRCIKREIGHLCHDEQRQKSTDKHPPPPQPKADATRAYGAGTNAYSTPVPTANPSWPLTGPFIYQPETLGNEFSVLTYVHPLQFAQSRCLCPSLSPSDFLETLDERSFFTPPPTVTSSLMAPNTFPPPLPDTFTNGSIASGTPAPTAQKPSDDAPPILPAATKTEKFLLTAADQESGSRDERLNRVIRSKYEAGLLKPYNYVKGYARLSRWMDRNVSQESKSQILQPLSVLRPKFRAVAQSLRDIDLVFIEEAFERMLLDYDRVFSAMGVPACLWRRTGEIYKANREFAELVGIDGYMMRDGRLCIYELMAEESAVNYWEKYGHVAFDSSQKAVLTSCEEETPMEEGFINCCFSFTIRRDKWGIPSMIVGNFIKC